MIYLEKVFTTDMVGKQLIKKYSVSDYFDSASLILKNPDMEDINDLLMSQKKMAGILESSRPSHLLVKFLIDIEKENLWFWNGVFSNTEYAFVDIMDYEPSIINNAGDVMDDGFFAGQSYLDITSGLLRTDELVARTSFEVRLGEMSTNDMEGFMAIFDDMVSYFDDARKIADRVLTKWYYSKKIEQYLKEDGNESLLLSIINDYAPDFESKVYQIKNEQLS